jgi:5-formyltetrahydrofolate cyclo-ligase
MQRPRWIAGVAEPVAKEIRPQVAGLNFSFTGPRAKVLRPSSFIVHPLSLPTVPSPTDLRNLKQQLRRRAEAARQAQPDKDALSRAICARFAALTHYAAAETVMLYVGTPSEVHTREFLSAAVAQGKRVVVPCCVGDEILPFFLTSLDELAPGRLGILEPRAELRAMPGRRVESHEIDVVMVPGAAFDRRGGRLGRGKGYYDRLLPCLRADAPAVGVAFECQLLLEIPMLPTDVFMDQVITEQGIYPGRGRAK